MSNLKVLSVIILFIFACTIPVAAQIAPLATVPMTFPGPMPIVEVMINEKGPFHFTIDTGAQMQASVESSIISQLNLKPNGQVRGGDFDQPREVPRYSARRSSPSNSRPCFRQRHRAS